MRQAHDSGRTFMNGVGGTLTLDRCVRFGLTLRDRRVKMPRGDVSVTIKTKALSTSAVTMSGAVILALMAPSAGATGTPRPPKSLFAGYSGGPTALTTESATVTLPTITCVKNRTAVDVTLGAITPTGFGGRSEAAVMMVCSKVRRVQNLVSSYVPYVEVANVTQSPGSVNPMPGDTITMTLTCGSSGTSVTLDDVTSSKAVTDTSSAPGACDYMSVGGGTRGVLPEMNSFAWTNVTVNGAPLSSFPVSASNWFKSFRKATLTTGPLTNGGTAFDETYAPPAL
jgi:hypothetical protein